MFTIGIEFIICVFLIIVSGTKLCTFGDVITERIGLGRTWVGVSSYCSGNISPGTDNHCKLREFCQRTGYGCRHYLWQLRI